MKWLTAVFWIFILLIIFLADTGQLGILSAIYHIPFADKVGHFILYGILVLLIDLTLFQSFPQRSRTSIAVASGLLLASLIGFEEFSQRFFENRTFSLGDLTASYLGLIVFAWLAVKAKTINGVNDGSR